MNLFHTLFQPMLIKEIDSPFDSKDYFFEIKYDGIRALIFASSNSFKILSRYQKDITFLFPELRKIQSLVNMPVIFDGEIVVFENGKSIFSKIQERISLKNEKKIYYSSQKEPTTFVAFDLLYEGKSLCDCPWIFRKNRLKRYPDTNYFIKSFGVDTYGIKLFQEIKKMGLEGIIAKKKNSIYETNTRTDSWLKIKNYQIGKFWILGYSKKKNGLSLLLGESKNHGYVSVGNVLVAFQNPIVEELMLSEKNEVNGIFYMKFYIKCQIKYLEKTSDGKLRHPIFLRKVN